MYAEIYESASSTSDIFTRQTTLEVSPIDAQCMALCKQIDCILHKISQTKYKYMFFRFKYRIVYHSESGRC
jgi:hypothetical protein